MITVAVSQGSESDSGLAADALPMGYCYLVDDDLSTPIEPALLYLCSAYPPKRGMWRRATVEAAAYDLCDWWRYLEHKETPWDEVTSDDLADYRDGLLSSVSVRQKAHFSVRTIARRIRAVGSFYAWSAKQGYFFGDSVSPTVTRNVIRKIDDDPLAHTGGRAHRVLHALAPRAPDNADDRVYPLSPPQWREVATKLGPLPSEVLKGYQGLSRNRLACEISIWAGLRVDEVAGLTVNQILDAALSFGESSVVAIQLVRTKGLRKRKVIFPRHLVDELILYIDGERQESIEVGGRYRYEKAHSALFVNGVDSRNCAGKPVRPATLSAAFKAAVQAAGLMRSVEKIHPESGIRHQVRVPAHTFHDLRHTFAVFLYQAEVSTGNSEPWKIIQSRLGHKQLKTTRDTYLRIVDIFRAKANDSVYRFLRSALGTQVA